MVLFFYASYGNAQSDISQINRLIIEAEKISKKNPDKAIKFLREATELDPEDANIKYLFGQALLERNDYLGAELQFEKAYKLQPKDKYEIALARAILSQNRADDVLATISEKGLTKETTVEKLNIIVKAKFLIGENAEAIEYLDKILNVDSDNKEALVQKTKAYILMQKLDKAEEVIKLVLEKDPNYVEGLIIYGELFLAQNNYKDALRYYDKALAIEPKNLVGLAGRARTYLINGDMDKTLIDSQKIIDLNPNDPMGWYMMASAYYTQGKINEANKVYNSGTHVLVTFPQGFLLAALLKFRLGEYARSELLLKDYLRYYPTDAQALQTMALLKLYQGSSREAITDLTEIVQTQPENYLALNMLGSAYLRIQDYDNADIIFREFVKRFPQQDSTASYALKWMCGSAQVKLDNQTYCQKPKDADIAEQMLKIVTYIYLGQTEEAEKALDILTKIQPNNLDVMALSAKVQANKDNYQDALSGYIKILTLNPEHIDALAGLSSLATVKKLHPILLEKLNNLYKEKNSIETGLIVSSVYYQMGDTPKAFEILQELQEKHPNNLKIAENIVRLSISDPRYYHIVKKFLSPLALKTQDIKTLEFLIAAANHIKDKKLMGEIIDIYLKRNNKPNYAYIRERGRIYQQMGDMPRAEQTYKMLIKTMPDKVNFYYDLVLVYIAQKKYDNALKTLEGLKTNHFMKTRLISLVYNKQGDKQKALALLQTEFIKNKNQNLLGDIYRLLKDMKGKESALEFLEKNYNKKGIAPKVGMMLANIYIQKKDYSKAEAILTPLKNNYYNNGYYLNNYALIRYYTGHKDAFTYAERALTSDGNNPNYQATYGLIAVSIGKYQEARAVLEGNLSSLDMNNPSLLYALVMAYAQTGRKDYAKQYYDKLLSFKEDYFEKSKLESLKKIL